jgi:hypothetical protein
MEAQLLLEIKSLLESFTAQGLPLHSQLPNTKQLQATILTAGLLSNPAVAQLQPEDLVDSAFAFIELIDQRMATVQPQTQVSALERLFRMN